jgi:hypothetical protein
LKPLAADMIELLEKSQQWVDPNLLQLKEEERRRGKGGKRQRTETPSVVPGATSPNKALHKALNKDKVNTNNDDDDDSFQGLTASRIVLKRSKHVAESSDDSSEGEDD